MNNTNTIVAYYDNECLKSIAKIEVLTGVAFYKRNPVEQRIYDMSCNGKCLHKMKYLNNFLHKIIDAIEEGSVS